MSTTRSISSGAVAAALYVCTVSPPVVAGAVPEDSQAKAHHLKNGKGFINPWESWRCMSGPQIGYTIVKRRFNGQANSVDTTPPTVNVRRPTFLESRAATSSLRATWLGHACYYVEFPNGLRVLFDPVFEERCSPFSWLGPKRYTPAPCVPADIPDIDVVIISHSHYDHLSHPTIKEIQRLHPNVLFAVPLGLKSWFAKSGVTNVVECDWWQDVDISLAKVEQNKPRVSVSTANTTSSDPAPSAAITARISCLPCQHTSARTPFDQGVTLWASWAVKAGGKSVWFGGDTGYRTVPELPKDVDDYGEEFKDLPCCPAFKQIGEFKGPFDLGLIPIGAYDPRHVMSPMHANPYDSVEIFTNTRCKRAMGIHWGSWVLTEEDVLEPPVLLRAALKRKGVAETGVFDVCDIGESREF